MSPKSPRGRPKLDPAVKLRTQLWAIAVRVQGDMAWDALDRLCLPALANRRDDERSRVLHRYFRQGHVPGSALVQDSDYPQGKSIPLVEAVSRIKGLETTRNYFDSVLWELLMPPGKSVAEIKATVRSLLAKRGWFQADDATGRIGWHLLPNDPAFDVRKTWDAKELAFHLSAELGLDSIALTAMLTRLAADATDYIAADVFQGSLAAVLLQTAPSFIPFDSPGVKRPGAREKNVIYSHVTLQLKRLIDQRVLRNQWPSNSGGGGVDAPTAVQLPGGLPQPDGDKDFGLVALSAMVERMWGPPGPFELGNAKWWPVVPRQHQHLWIEENKVALAGGIRLEFAELIARTNGGRGVELLEKYALDGAKTPLRAIKGFKTHVKQRKR